MSNTSVVYLSSLLRSCIPLCAIYPAKQTHAQVLLHGFISNITLQTDLLLAYSKCGVLQEARQVFDKMTERRSMHSWNILIASYTQNSMYHDALSVFNRLMEMGIQPDHYTLPPVFMACIGMGDTYLGKALHGWVIGLGFEKYVVVGTSILDFYVKCCNFEDAHRFFVEMPCKDTVVWNSMISGMGRAGLFVNAFMYLRDMLWEGVKMDSRTIPSILNACGGHGDLMKGREVHGQVLKNLGLHKDVAVENSLIDMYAKCGCLHYSEKVFDNMHDLNLVTWTTMISCYGVHGKGEESLVLFEKMRDYGFKPNSVTLTAILASCSHSGLLVQGRKIFNSICLEYDIERSVEHYACMVNLLGRFGYLEEAFELTKNVKLTTAASVWGALLAGCMMQRNVEIGEIAAHRLFELEPRNSSNYIALCNIYDSQGIREGVSRIRAKMRELGLVKAPGCSWITIAGKVHKFYQGDLSHPSTQMILETLENFQGVDVFVEKSLDRWSHLTKREVKHSSMPNISNPTKLFPIFSATTNYGRSVLCELSRSMSSSTSSPVPTHDHISHLILDQKSASQALQTFRWASKLPSFTHSQSTYRALIHKLCSFRRFDTVKDLLDEMPRSIGSPPDEDIFITIVRGLGRSRMIKQVINVLDLVSRFEKKPSLKLFNSILNVLVKEDIDLAREFYRKKIMGSGLQGDDYTYGILMKGLCLTNRIGDGFKLLQAMKSRGVTPNTVIYNTLIHALCKNGKVGRARSFMNEMSEPNGVTFNILISAYCGEENLVQALVLLDKSFNLEFVPDVVTVTKVLELLCSEGRVKEGLEVLERVESKGGAADVVAYNTLIKGFCKLGKVKVGHRFLKEMESKGCLPNIDTYNILVSGFCELGMLDSVLDLFDDMKTDGIRGNFITYDTLIRGLCSRGRIEDGFKILEEMEESRGGAGGRISPYNSVIYGLYKENHLDEALEFLTKMERLFPKTVDRSLRIIRFCEEGSIENGKKVYDQLIGEGEIPSAIVYVCLIHKYCHEGSVREAFELINEMVSHGFFPVASTFNAVIGAFCRQGMVGSASKLLEDMAGRGCCKPNAGTYSTLIDALCRKGESQKAIKIFIQMVEDGIIPNHHTWSLIIHCCLISRETKWLERNNMFCVNNLLQCIVEK